NITVSDNVWWNITSDSDNIEIEVTFENNSWWRTVSGFTLIYEGFLNATLSNSAEISVWDAESSMWDAATIDINSASTSFKVTQAFDYRHVDYENNNRVLVKLSLKNTGPFNISIDQLVINVTTLSGQNNTLFDPNIRSFDLTNSYSAILNCSGIGALPETELSVVSPNNFTDPYTVPFLNNVTLTTLYNASLPYGATTPDTITADITIKGTTTIIVNDLSLTNNGTTGYSILNFNTSEYLAAGVYVVTVTASKRGFESAEYSFDLNVSSLSAALDLPSYISTYYTFNATLNVSYVYNSMDMSNWTLSYHLLANPEINGTINITDALLNDGNYNLTFNTSGLNQGFHNLIVSASKQNYTSDSQIVSLEILGLPTLINGSNSDFDASKSIYIESNRYYYFQFNDSINSIGIDDLDTMSWSAKKDGADYTSGNLESLGNGLYKLDFNMNKRPIGDYTIWVTFYKNNYEIKKAVIFLKIELIPITPQFDAPLINVDQGSSGTFIVTLTDAYNQSLTGATIEYSWSGGTGTFQELGSGQYSLTIDNTGRAFAVSIYTITYNITKANHTTVTGTITVNIDYYKVFGLIPEPLFWGIVITAIIAVVAVSSYVGVKRARIPYEIKKIDETIKGIKKEKGKLPYPILKTKAELFEEIFKENWAVINLPTPVRDKRKALQDDFIELLSSIKKIRMTAYEAETLRSKLISLSHTEALELLASMGIPPDTAERIIKLAKK
ncbi:MAG: hypothetical protein ACTSX4_06775, partial [Candidatus Helarchaeota archaeon]